MEINYFNLLDILGEEVMDTYESHIGRIEMVKDWNELKSLDVPILSIAIYVILNNVEPRLEIEEGYLKRIRKRVSEIKTKLAKASRKDFDDEWMKKYNPSVVEGRLGKCAELFLRELDDDALRDTIKDTQKKYLYQKDAYLQMCLQGKKDEIEVVKEFLRDIEEEKESYLSLYKKVRAYNQNTPNPELNPTAIDESLKKELARRLRNINVSESKINRLVLRAVKCIKKEILHFN